MTQIKTLLMTFVVVTASPAGLADDRQIADTVLTGGKIYTVDKQQPWVEAVAIKDGVYIAVGSDEAIQPYVGDATKVVALEGRMAMPGINDAHTHLYGGLKELSYCIFPYGLTSEDIAARVADCVAADPDQEFILGGYWVSNFFDENDIGSPKAWLDKISSDIPIVLSDDSGHNAWVNSAALEQIGFDKDTVDPPSGTIVRDANGEPNGLLFEVAAIQVEAEFESRWDLKTVREGYGWSIKLANRFGITGIKDASARLNGMQALYEIDQEQGLTAHVAFAMWTPYGQRSEALGYDEYTQRAEQYRSANMHTNFIKFFLDGVPTSSRTASMLEPYLPEQGQAEEDRTTGMLHLQGDRLAEDLIELDKRGFTVKLHAAGDGAVREALNAIERTRKANGDSGLIHEIAHAGFIDEADLPRFRELNVAADISPYLWYPSPIMDSVVGAVGERGRFYWPNRDLLDDGAFIVAGSDWPSVSPTASPWPGIEATVSRRDPYGAVAGEFWPEQALSLAETLEIFTLNGAIALGLGDKTGVVEVGRYADLIVLDRNLFDIPAEHISDTEVLATWFKGNLVHEAESGASD